MLRTDTRIGRWIYTGKRTQLFKPLRVPEVRQCETCPAFICYTGRGNRKRYCSICSYKAYQAMSKRYREKYPENCRQGRHRRRARMKNAEHESFTLEDVIALHGSNCALCETPVDMSLEWPHPYSKSEDHTIPISRGGNHTLSNVKLAHLRCNQRKSDKL